MFRPLFRPASTLLAMLLCSCGFMTPAQQYAGESRPGAEIAVVQTYLGSPFGSEYHATIAAYATRPEAGAAVVKRFGLPGFTDYPREIQLTPGHYALELYCFKSLAKPTFRPTLDLTVQAGHAYTVKCEPTEGGATVFVSQDTQQL